MKFKFKKLSPAEKKKRANTPKQVAQRKKAFQLRKGKKTAPKTYFV